MTPTEVLVERLKTMVSELDAENAELRERLELADEQILMLLREEKLRESLNHLKVSVRSTLARYEGAELSKELADWVMDEINHQIEHVATDHTSDVE